MVETLTVNWVGIVALIIAFAIAGILIYLFKKGKMQTDDISAIAGVIDKVGDVLENFGKGDSVVALLAKYATKAVHVVEQFVKNGELEKDNRLRKNEAKAIIEQLAAADGVDLELVYDNDETIGNLIEAAVNEMQSGDVKIKLGVEDMKLPSALE